MQLSKKKRKILGKKHKKMSNKSEKFTKIQTNLQLKEMENFILFYTSYSM